MSKTKKLTNKQALFVKEYVVDLNGTQAATRAGFSAKTANEQASRMLANVHIRSAVQKAMDDRAKRTDITADYVLTTIRETIERCKQAEPAKDKAGKPTGEFQFDASNVLRGTELLGKHLKLWTDKVEHSVTGTLEQYLAKQ